MAMPGLVLFLFVLAAGCRCPPDVYDDARDYHLPYPYASAFLLGQPGRGILELLPVPWATRERRLRLMPVLGPEE